MVLVQDKAKISLSSRQQQAKLQDIEERTKCLQLWCSVAVEQELERWLTRRMLGTSRLGRTSYEICFCPLCACLH